jgi:hypothetical protein
MSSKEIGDRRTFRAPKITLSGALALRLVQAAMLVCAFSAQMTARGRSQRARTSCSGNPSR